MRIVVIALASFWITSSTLGATDTLPAGAEEAGGYYQFRTWQVELRSDGFREKVRHRFTILNPRGDRLAYLSVTSSQFYLLDAARVEVFDAKGKPVYSRKESDWARSCGFGASFMLYQDVCVRRTRATGPNYPYTIEWEAEWHSNSLFFWRSPDLQQEVPVVQATYELRSPSDLSFQYKCCGLAIEPEVRVDGGRSVYMWTATNISGRDAQGEEYLTPEDQQFARIIFSPRSFRMGQYECRGSDWDAIAAWYRDMARDRYGDTAVPSNPRFDSMSVRDRMNAIYRSVVDSNRYVAISIGVGGWQPHHADSTERNGYGDCKDLATLLVSRLRRNGIEAYPVLVLTRGAGLVDMSFPAAEFNHVIAMAPSGEDTVWMDPTCDVCAFGDLPAADEDIYVLVVTNDRGVMVRTPTSGAADNRLLRRTRVTISSRLIPSFESDWTACGNWAVGLEGVLKYSDSEERIELLKRRLSRSSRQWSIEMPRFEMAQADFRELNMTLRGASPKPMVNLSSGYILSPFCFSPASPQEDIDLSKRALSVDMGFPRQLVDSVVVTWPRQLIIDSVTAPSERSCAYSQGSCSLQLLQYQDSVVAVLISQADGYELPPGEFAAFRSYCSARNRLAEACIHFRERKPGE